MQAFDLKGLSKAPAIFNTEKLVWFNHEYITRMPFEEYLAMATPWFDRVLAGKGIDYRRLAELMHTRTEVFDRVPDMVRFLAELPEYGVELYTHKKMKTDSVVALRALELARPAMASLESFTEEAVKDCLMALAAENGLKTGQMMWPCARPFPVRLPPPAARPRSPTCWAGMKACAGSTRALSCCGGKGIPYE